ncbi:MAG: GntR family transcriptional regulator [Castellaniella sp.]|uniref:GntR family transcriptional regulator n=1 Tax=Castellaniella sp. TaxID=1955812 RepID=UPI003A8A406F
MIHHHDDPVKGALSFALAPIQTTSLRDEVHERLRLAIVSGYYKTGERLNERKLAEEMGVSTSPVKEGLRRLEAEGLVRTEPRRGSFVTFAARQAEEMTLARAVLESLVAGMAARHASAQDLVRLQALLAEMKAALAEDDVDHLVTLNSAFHETVRAASGSTYLHGLVNSLHAFSLGTRVAVLSDRQVRAESLNEHTAIYQAIVRRDVARAESLMRRHITAAGQAHVELLFHAVQTTDGAHT